MVKTYLKTILIFKEKELLQSIRYKTKKEAIGNYKLFKKYGHFDYMTGEKIHGLIFELL
jgi:hypothetical protein